MEKIKELTLTEMQSIYGGTNPAYEIGYAFGKAIRTLLFVDSFMKYLRLP